MESEAPILTEIFSKISKLSPESFCYMCLRTQKERNLKNSKAFKNLVVALKLNSEDPLGCRNYKICYMCEKKAYNALCFFRAASSAININRMFVESEKKRIFNKQEMFERTFFKKLLNRIGLGSKSLPFEWEAEMKAIRRHSQLLETETLVVDHKGLQTNSSEAMIVPDPIPTVAGQDFTGHFIKNEAIDFSCQTDISSANKHPLGSNTMGVLSETTSHTHSEIIEYEEDPLRLDTPTPTNINPIPHTSISILNTRSNNLNINTTSTSISNTSPKILVHQNPCNNNKVLITKDNNFLLHPIILTSSGTLSVPTLSASITNGHIIRMDAQKLQKESNTTLKKMLSQPQNTNFRVTADIAKRVFDTPIITSVDKITVSEFDSNSPVLPASKKIKICQSKDAVPTKDKSTDWEDKIPMDVISFMDAVDPNAANPFGNVGVSEVRSLAPTPNKKQKISNDQKTDEIVIDLS